MAAVPDVLQLDRRQALTFEYAALRAGMPPDGACCAMLSEGYLERHAAAVAIVEDEPPEPPAEPVTRLGDVWRLGEHVLVCGDSTESAVVSTALRGKRVPLIFTDPPYNVAGHDISGTNLRDSYARLKASPWDKDFSFASVQDSIMRGLADDGSVYICTQQHLAGDIWEWMRRWADFYSYIVWTKNNPMPSLHKRHWTWNTELICYATRGRHTFNFPLEGHALSTWAIAKSRVNDLHPTMKPVAVPAHAIAHSSAPRDIVRDLFGGAGSTLLAAEQLGRKAPLIEIDPAYCDVIVSRYEAATGNKAVRA